MSQDKKNIGSVIVVCIQFSKLVSKIEQVGDCMEKKGERYCAVADCGISCDILGKWCIF